VGYLERSLSVGRRTPRNPRKKCDSEKPKHALEITLLKIDPLTQLYNRRAFNALIGKEYFKPTTKPALSATLIVLTLNHLQKK